MVPFFDLTRQYRAIEDEILTATRRVYEKGRFVLDAEVRLFEEEFARFCGVRYGVGVGSGTDALTLALKAAGVGEGDEVVTVANSFIASALAISFTGATPVFVDIDPKTHTMDPNALDDLLKHRRKPGRGKRIKAILPVHLYGHPAEMGDIMEIADRHHLLVIEDACQAHGALYRGERVGSIGLLGCFSFYPTKNLGGFGDGGMVVTDHKKYYEQLRLLRCYGEQKRYHHVLVGGNSRLDELQAAILRTKLTHLEAWNERRREKAKAYTEKLGPLGVFCPEDLEGSHPVYHLYVIRAKRRNALQKFLKEHGIETRVHYPIPIHLQKAYKGLNYRKGDLPVTELCSREIVSLPFFPEMTGEEIEEVGETIRRFTGRRKESGGNLGSRGKPRSGS